MNSKKYYYFRVIYYCQSIKYFDYKKYKWTIKLIFNCIYKKKYFGYVYYDAIKSLYTKTGYVLTHVLRLVKRKLHKYMHKNELNPQTAKQTNKIQTVGKSKRYFRNVFATPVSPRLMDAILTFSFRILSKTTMRLYEMWKRIYKAYIVREHSRVVGCGCDIPFALGI